MLVLLLALLLATLVAAALILVQTQLLGSPPLPSNRKIRTAIARLLDEEVEDGSAGRMRVVELGSGWGGLVRWLARKHPRVEFAGVERSIVPGAWSRTIGLLGGPSNVGLTRCDLYEALETALRAAVSGGGESDTEESAVLEMQGPRRLVFLAYLAPRHMNAIEASLRRLPQERNAELVLISAAFALPRSTPERVVRVRDLYRTPVYRYRL